MSKTRELANTPEKGQKRYRLYKDVIDHYHKAIENRFYLEAITLMESIITDRLESTLVYYGLIPCEDCFRTMESCIREFDTERGQGILSDALLNRIKDWKNGRNHALHEMAKIEDGDNTPFEQRYSDQERIAKHGYDIFNEIKKETR